MMGKQIEGDDLLRVERPAMTVRALGEYSLQLEQRMFEQRVRRAKGELRLAPLRSMSDAARRAYENREETQQ